MSTRIITAAIFAIPLVAPVISARDGVEKPDKPANPTEALERQVKRFKVGATLEKTFERIEEVSGLKISPDWTAIEDTGVTRDTRVVMRVSRATVTQLLDLVVAQVSARGRPLAWYVDGEVVRFTTQMRVLHRDAPRAPAARTDEKRRAKPLETKKIEFDKTPLRDVIGFVRDLTGINIHVNWRALEAVGIGKQTPVTINVSNVSSGRLLTLITDYVSAGRTRYDRIYWIIDEGVVEISTGTTLNSKFKTRVYDVSDLLAVVPNFKGPQMDLAEITRSADTSESGQGESIFTEGAQEDEDGKETKADRGEKLVKTIKDSIGEDMWQPMGRGSIRLMGNRLIITQSLLGFKLMDDTLGRR